MDRKRNKIIVVVMVSAALAAIIAAGVWQIERRNRSEQPFVSNGRLEAREVHLASRLSGRVEQVLVDEGFHVAVGDKLVVLKSDSLQAQLQRAEAQIRQAEDGLALAKARQFQRCSESRFAQQHLQRTVALKKKQYVSDEQLDDAKNRYHSAHAACTAANAQVAASRSAVDVASATSKQLRVELDDMQLSAPLSAYVLYRLVEPGEVVPAGGRVMTLLSDSDIYMTIFLPSKVAGKLSMGDNALIKLDARADTMIPATVSFISPVAQFTPKTVETQHEREKLVFRVKLSVQSDFVRQHHAWLKSGMPGTAILPGLNTEGEFLNSSVFNTQ